MKGLTKVCNRIARMKTTAIARLPLDVTASYSLVNQFNVAAECECMLDRHIGESAMW